MSDLGVALYGVIGRGAPRSVVVLHRTDDGRYVASVSAERHRSGAVVGSPADDLEGAVANLRRALARIDRGAAA